MGSINKGLETDDYHYFIAAGETLQQLQSYDRAFTQWINNVKAFVETNKADCASSTARFAGSRLRTH